MDLAQASTVGMACFVDVETTGLCSRTEEVIELAICLFEYSKETGEIVRMVDRYVGLREPSVPISYGAARIHGLKLKDLCGKQLDCARIEAILHTAEFIVAHNASFDRGFVTRLFPISSRKHWLCSMSGINWKGKGFASRGLQNLLRDHGITAGQAHRAEDDVMATLRLLARRGSDGRWYFAELLTKLPVRKDTTSEAG